MAGYFEDLLNRSMPVSLRTKVGTMFAELIAGVNALMTRTMSMCLSSAGLVISGAGGLTGKAGSAFVAMVSGVPVFVAANTAMSALVGTIATTKFACWVWYVDGAGVITTSAKTADAATAVAALALVPSTPVGKAMVGILLVQNAAAGGFIGGTTALDAASVTGTYLSTVGISNFAGNVESTILKTVEQRNS